MLLLWADVDRPPDWLVDDDVFVCDSLDKTITNIARVWLDVNTFQWLFHNDISECYILNTSVALTRWHRSYGQSNTVSDQTVFNGDVLTAFSNLVPLV